MDRDNEFIPGLSVRAHIPQYFFKNQYFPDSVFETNQISLDF